MWFYSYVVTHSLCEWELRGSGVWKANQCWQICLHVGIIWRVWIFFIGDNVQYGEGAPVESQKLAHIEWGNSEYQPGLTYARFAWARVVVSDISPVHLDTTGFICSYSSWLLSGMMMWLLKLKKIHLKDMGSTDTALTRASPTMSELCINRLQHYISMYKIVRITLEMTYSRSTGWNSLPIAACGKY